MEAPLGCLPEGKIGCCMQKKSSAISELFLINIGIGNDLSSREATLRVLSAREVFTTVFGMGTGGVLLLGHQKGCTHSTFELDFE